MMSAIILKMLSLINKKNIFSKYKLVGDAVKEVDDQSQAGKKNRPGTNCWNCGGSGHSNRECTLPVNRENLARNRQQFKNSRPFRNGLRRYHTDNEQKYDHFKPGILSRSLRKALGLTGNQLPRHIYNMRLLGYPPGWLEEAKVVHSGITLFDSKGHAVADPDDEEGEVVDNIEQRNKYDINKLIQYPGFNVPPSSETVDDCDKMKVPPFSIDQSIDRLADSLRPNEAKTYCRKKVPVIPSTSPPQQDESVAEENCATDMEYEETPEIGFLPEDGCGFVPPLPDEPLPPPPPDDIPEPTYVEDGEYSSHSGEADNCDSPTLVELEEQKKSILTELNYSDSSDSLKGKEIVSMNVIRIKNESVARTPSPNLGRMKSVDLGTPVLKSVSPYSKLPSPESFSQNICDVINFENLPDSTGIYDKMVGILSKVRSSVKRIHHNADY
ncbi:zinc finger CCHC domain-containing protein 8 homolog isoform X2 [Lycorma delicatula]|uniref:zinc finger CCHC domain-containing protein 8 homolog isoform X2 n=1 Tax=Lycorma delicatula TaxID=130591 RepID=UPI003F50E55E